MTLLYFLDRKYKSEAKCELVLLSHLVLHIRFFVFLSLCLFLHVFTFFCFFCLYMFLFLSVCVHLPIPIFTFFLSFLTFYLFRLFLPFSVSSLVVLFHLCSLSSYICSKLSFFCLYNLSIMFFVYIIIG